MIRRDETCRFLVNSDTKHLTCAVWDHKTLGKDKMLGDALVDVCNFLFQNLPFSKKPSLDLGSFNPRRVVKGDRGTTAWR